MVHHPPSLDPRSSPPRPPRAFQRATRFLVTAGAFQVTLRGLTNAFVTKLNASFTALLYSTYLGGNNTDVGQGIAVDGGGHAYITGYTRSFNFPATGFQHTLRGTTNAFVTELNASGTGLVSSTYLGGSANDFGRGIAVDAAGNAYVTGFTSSADFPTTSGAFQTINQGAVNAFVAKVNASGTALVYSTYLGGSQRDEAFAIAVDAAGDAYVTGAATSSDFPGTSYNGPLPGVFVTAFEPTGSAASSTILGGAIGAGIAVDGAGATYLTGFTSTTDFPTTSGAFQTTLRGSVNAFVAKLTPGTLSVPVRNRQPALADDHAGLNKGSPNTFVAKFLLSSVASPLVVAGFPSPTTAGAIQTFTVMAQDAAGTIDTGHTGAVGFTGSDPQADLLFDSPLTNGATTFTDVLSGIGGTATVNVS